MYVFTEVSAIVARQSPECIEDISGLDFFLVLEEWITAKVLYYMLFRSQSRTYKALSRPHIRRFFPPTPIFLWSGDFQWSDDHVSLCSHQAIQF